jgi:hypothetical protein
MFFDFIIKNNPIVHPQVNKALLWEYDLSSFDWTAMRRTVVQRVIERGREEDFLAIFRLYGGIEGVRKIIRDEVPWLSPIDMSFAYRIFGLKKEDLKCYTRAQSRAKLLNC